MIKLYYSKYIGFIFEYAKKSIKNLKFVLLAGAINIKIYLNCVIFLSLRV